MYKFVCLFACFVIAANAAFPSINPMVGPSTNPAPVSQEAVWRIGNISANMYERWEAYDAACNPKAVFAMAYLFMTHNARNLVRDGYFDNGNKMVNFVTTFAARYIEAIDEWESGRTWNVSQPWAVYFSSLESNRTDVTQDITIGMNAHINYDLAIAAYQEGYAVPQWRDDYFRINDLMAQIDPNITHNLGRYDPQFYNTDFVSLVYFHASIEFVTSWRTSAYATAISYQNALTSVIRQTIRLANEVTIAAVSTGIAIPYPYQTAPDRIAYCQANHYPMVLS